MIQSGMERGVNESYERLSELLKKMNKSRNLKPGTTSPFDNATSGRREVGHPGPTKRFSARMEL